MLDPNTISRNEQLKVALEDFMHEARTFNGRMHASAQTISRGVQGNNIDKQNLSFHAQTILEQTTLLSLWMDLIQMDLNPTFFSAEKSNPEKIHGKFYKAEIGLRPAARKKNIKIKLTGDDVVAIDAYPVIDILPYIILENAIKYSPAYSPIDVHFETNLDYVVITVSSMGPTLSAGEAQKIFERGFRSGNPFVRRTAGQGKGLYFAKFICEIHGGHISHKSGAVALNYEGDSFSEFRIIIQLPR